MNYLNGLLGNGTELGLVGVGGWLRIAVIEGSVTLSQQPLMGPNLQAKEMVITSQISQRGQSKIDKDHTYMRFFSFLFYGFVFSRRLNSVIFF